ncbi:MAG: UvrB/UvrC motif-containing protein [Ectobacillus sp.]
MICQECKSRPATLHFTKVVNGEKSEVHICEHCAKEKGYSSFFSSGNSNFSFHNLLSGLLNADHPAEEKKVNPFTQVQTIMCQNCHMTYPQFTKLGRFGCAHCYKTFESQLDPILRRLHSGNTVHKGKIPKRIGGNLHLRKELEELKRKMQHYIQREEFEQAAKARDRIRKLEQQLSAHRKEE